MLPQPEVMFKKYVYFVCPNLNILKICFCYNEDTETICLFDLMNNLLIIISADNCRWLTNRWTCFSFKMHTSTKCLLEASLFHTNNLTCVLFMTAWGIAGTSRKLSAEGSQSSCIKFTAMLNFNKTSDLKHEKNRKDKNWKASCLEYFFP